VHLAKERRALVKKVTDNDFELDSKRLKLASEQLPFESNATDLLKPRRPSHMTEMILRPLVCLRSARSQRQKSRSLSKTQISISSSTRKGLFHFFVHFWAKIVLLIHIYIIFTVFFFLGISGFPSGAWLAIEAITETIILSDILLRIIIRRKFLKNWENMWVLHDQGQNYRFQMFLSLLGSMPTSILCCLIVDKAQLHSFGFAMLRAIKLLRMKQINQYFDSTDIHGKKTISSYLKSLQVFL